MVGVGVCEGVTTGVSDGLGVRVRVSVGMVEDEVDVGVLVKVGMVVNVAGGG